MNENETMSQDSTTVDQVDINIDEIFGMPGAESIMLPEEEEKKTVFHTEEPVDTTFIDNPVEEVKTTTTETEEEKPEVTASEVQDTIDELDDVITSHEDQEATPGRRKTDKNGLQELAAKMIEEGSLFGFDDDKELEDYTTKDFRELFEANFQEREKKVAEKLPQEFFQSLPEELQVAAKYVADGGQDLKGLFRTLAQVEEMRQLDVTNEYDQAEIARQYLNATGFGTPEEIEQEITDWKDLDRIEQKANQFKPKLDAMQEEIVGQQLAAQEHKKEQQAEQSKAYQENVYSTLSSGTIGGLKLDKKVQGLLFSGLVQPNYPSISGKPTNLLGHLLEKYQFVEPRHDLIAEALWLLADPNGYKTKVRDQGGKQAVEKTVRQLKTEQSRKRSSSSISNEYEKTSPARKSSKTSKKTVSKNNMFKRF
tara:strand:+ start:1617 stop:2888 length:1272 start_codon:yes stop_codon:yes gene_type:complete